MNAGADGTERDRVELREADWQRLAEMRAQYLEGGAATGALPFVWRDARDLELYEAGFAQRIAWKWRAVLDELARIAEFSPGGPVLDWGCGTGIASRELLARFGGSRNSPVHLWDRSPLARAFACERVRAEHPDVIVHEGQVHTQPARILLASHVLNELDEEEEAELCTRAAQAEWFVWVEPGDRATSRRLAAARARLLATFEARAPCTHSAACGVLAPGRERDWCHHFARPPAEVHQSARWARFKKELGIDLSSLPYSYLILERRPSGGSSSSPAAAPRSDAGLARVLGRPRITKGRAQLDNCSAEGVRTQSFLQRDDPALFKRLRESAGERLVFRWSVAGERVRPVPADPHPS